NRPLSTILALERCHGIRTCTHGALAQGGSRSQRLGHRQTRVVECSLPELARGFADTYDPPRSWRRLDNQGRRSWASGMAGGSRELAGRLADDGTRRAVERRNGVWPTRSRPPCFEFALASRQSFRDSRGNG